MTRINRIALAATAAALTMPTPLAAQPVPETESPAVAGGFIWEYAVKVVCGRQAMTPAMPVAQGVYYTAVNVHNPGAPTKFIHKVAVALPGQGGPVTSFMTMGLKHDQALEIDCPHIVKQAQMGFVKGFAVIRASQPLDVVAVYTAAPLNNPHVSTMHTERVPPRRLQ